MRLLQLHVCFSLLVCGGALAQPQEPIPVLTVCEALNGLQEYNGRIEIVVGRASYTDEGSWLGAECGGAVVTEGFKWPDSISTSDPFSQFDPALEMPKTFHWNADTLVRKLAVVQKTTTLRKYSGNLSQYNDRWIAIFGRLETRVPLAIWTYPSGERRGIGFGHLGSAPARLVYCAMCYREIKPTRRSK